MSNPSQVNTTRIPPLSYCTGQMPFLSSNQQCQSTEGNEPVLLCISMRCFIIFISVCHVLVLCLNNCMHCQTFSPSGSGISLSFLSPTAITKFQENPFSWVLSMRGKKFEFSTKIALNFRNDKS